MPTWMKHLGFFCLVATAVASANPLLKNIPKAKKAPASPPIRLFDLSKRDSRPLSEKEAFLPNRVYSAPLPGKKQWVVILTDAQARIPKPFIALQPGTVLPSEFLGSPDKGNYLLTPQLRWVPTSQNEVQYQAILSVPARSRIVGFRAAVVQPEQVVVPTILEQAATAQSLGVPASGSDCLAYSDKAWVPCGERKPANRVIYQNGKFTLTDGYGTVRVGATVRTGSCLSPSYFGSNAIEKVFLRDEKTWVWLNCWEKAELDLATSPPKIESWIVEKLTRPLASLQN